MRCRTSQTLVFHACGDRYIVFNFLTKSAFSAAATLLSVLDAFAHWQDKSCWETLFPGKSGHSVQREIRKLVSLGALIAEDTPEAALEARFLAQWEWNLATAMLQFGLQDIPYRSSETAVAEQLRRAETDPSPELYTKHRDPRIALQKPANNPLNRVIRARRTHRDARPVPITVAQLAECLFAGLGIVGEVATETGTLPLATTPSGGARNPFEAYVFARQITGLEAGIYHYSARQHSLRRLPDHSIPRFGALLGNQDWADAMSCLIVLVAQFERTMWKYSDSNAYRVVLIEAGHIGQNIMLAATNQGLSACPTAALAHSAIHKCLGLTRLTHAALYALTLSVPKSDT
jgi:SagB-type dehydrogenase family enzyme